MATPILVESGLADLLEPEGDGPPERLDSGVQWVVPPAAPPASFAAEWDEDVTNLYEPGAFAVASFHASRGDTPAPAPSLALPEESSARAAWAATSHEEQGEAPSVGVMVPPPRLSAPPPAPVELHGRRTTSAPPVHPQQPLLDARAHIQPLTLIDLEFEPARPVGDPLRRPSSRPVSDGSATNPVHAQVSPAPLPVAISEPPSPRASIIPLPVASSELPSPRGSIVPLPIARPVASDPPPQLSSGAWGMIAAATAASAIAIGLLVLHYASAARDGGQDAAPLAPQPVSTAAIQTTLPPAPAPAAAAPVAPAVALTLEPAVAEPARLDETALEVVDESAGQAPAYTEHAEDVADAADAADVAEQPTAQNLAVGSTRARRSASSSAAPASSVSATPAGRVDGPAASDATPPPAARTATPPRDEQQIRAALALPNELEPLETPATVAPTAAPRATPTAAPSGATTTAAPTGTATTAAPTGTAPTAAPTSATMGTLTVTSTPTAVVYVDGRLVGYTPLSGVQLPPGRHRVLLVRSDTPVRRTLWLNVEAGQAISRSVDLQTQ